MVSIPTSRYRPDLEKERFRTIGGSSDETGTATQLYGETSANVVIPINSGKIPIAPWHSHMKVVFLILPANRSNHVRDLNTLSKPRIHKVWRVADGGK